MRPAASTTVDPAAGAAPLATVTILPSLMTIVASSSTASASIV
jgi:hypothetical protein